MANAKEIIQDPKRAENVDRLQKCFEREYDLTNPNDKMTLVEALGEIGKQAAMTGTKATVSLGFGANGLTGASLSVIPSEV